MNKLQWNFNQNTKLFIHANASEYIVFEMAAILSRGRWVNMSEIASTGIQLLLHDLESYVSLTPSLHSNHGQPVQDRIVETIAGGQELLRLIYVIYVYVLTQASVRSLLYPVVNKSIIYVAA